MSLVDNLNSVKENIPENVTLVAVSKTKPSSDILELYNAGYRVFGENKIQELTQKYEELPKDIKWHLIGHVQTNKVKYIASFVDLIHAVDSLKLLKEIDKRAAQHNRVINCLLQVKIAQEETKYGLLPQKAIELLNSPEINGLKNVNLLGLMGMATNTQNKSQISKEFHSLKILFDKLKITFPNFKILSMGMSGDYQIAIKEGSSMVRVGSSIFGKRNYV